MDVMLGIDPHKSSHTAVVVDDQGEVLDQLRITAGRRQLALLLAFAEKWPRRRFAVEGANGLGRLVAQQLVEAGEAVIDVPPTLSTRYGCSPAVRHARPTRTTPARPRSRRCTVPGYVRWLLRI